MNFPKSWISTEASSFKFWRWWAKSKTKHENPAHWSCDAEEDQYVSFTLKSGDSIVIPVAFDRTAVKTVDVFQIWLMNLRSVSALVGNGVFKINVNNEFKRFQLLRASGQPDAYGTSLILNFDDPLDIKGATNATFKLLYSGDPIFIKSLELYAVVIPK